MARNDTWLQEERRKKEAWRFLALLELALLAGFVSAMAARLLVRAS